jgi:hypothetical protein
MYALKWTIALLEDRMPAGSLRIQRVIARRGKGSTIRSKGKAVRSDVKTVINERFASIPAFKNI